MASVSPEADIGKLHPFRPCQNRNQINRAFQLATYRALCMLIRSAHGEQFLMTPAQAPSHVPPSLIRDFDFLTAVHDDHGDHAWKTLRGMPEIFWTPRNGGHWVLTKHAHILAVAQDPARFSSSTQTLPRTDKPFRIPPIEYDPPEHTEYRRLLTPFFTPKKMADLELRTKQLSISIVDGLIEKGECEFVAEVALVIPIGIFIEMVGLLDSDRLFLVECADLIVRGSPEEKIAGYQRIFDYLDGQFEERRRNPRADDVLSAILQSKIDGGRPLNQSETLGMGALLLAAGLDTVAGMMSLIMIHLAKNESDRLALARAPHSIGSALEELMRRYQIINLAREVVCDVELGGVLMKAGDTVLGPTPLAGMDEGEYPEPIHVDFTRVKKRSLIFGAGPHMCLGQFLARMELKVFLNEWLNRIPNFGIAPSAEPVLVGGPANSVKSLFLTWDATQMRHQGGGDEVCAPNER